MYPITKIKLKFFKTHQFTLVPIHVRLKTEVSGQYIYLFHRTLSPETRCKQGCVMKLLRYISFYYIWFKLPFRFWSVRSGTRQPAPLRNPWSRPVQRDNLPILPEKGRIIHLKVLYLYGASVCLYILLCMSVSPFSLVKQF